MRHLFPVMGAAVVADELVRGREPWQREEVVPCLGGGGGAAIRGRGAAPTADAALEPIVLASLSIVK